MALGADPLWYKDAIIYELHIKAFADSNGDGIGDFAGLRQRLDYLEGLGVTAIWLLPFYPSPLKDDGYDIADYMDINPDYGSLRDFRDFLHEAHRRGIRVITELVLNHTSDQHAWFQRSRRAPMGSAWRNYYVWSDTPDKYQEARIIFQDFEHSNWSWDPLAGAYFWHRFYSHQPDLNFDNPQVHKALLKVIDFWLKMGVDGMRLDAVPYLYEREGTNCENLPETYEFLAKLRAFVDERYPGRMLLAEANQWPEDAVAYFGPAGDRCNMAFHFPLMPRMFMALQLEDRYPVVDIMEQTPPIPATCQWALFLRNHDELTLEMVTDEERDYMYKMYARDPRARINLGIRRRLAPLLSNDRKKIELMNIMLFTLPGSVVLYYGDELGMGDNYYLGDRDGVRTPMQWSPDRNAGFSKANPQGLYLPVIIDPEYHYEAINVENQEANEASLLWWTRHLIAMRKAHKALSRGDFRFLFPDNSKILAYLRRLESETILVTVNLSKYSQLVTLDLKEYEGCRLEEVFSRNVFPPVREGRYTLTLPGYGFFIFQVCKEYDVVPSEGGAGLGLVEADRPWAEFFLGKQVEAMEQDILPGYIRACRWFGGKAREIQSVRFLEAVPVGHRQAVTHVALIEIGYKEGPPETYLLPLSHAVGEEASRIEAESPKAAICRIALPGEGEALVYDGLYDRRFCRAILSMITTRRKVGGHSGRLVSDRGKGLLAQIRESGKTLEELMPTVLRAEQSNTSVLFGDRLIFKVFRKVEEGTHPDLELGRYLTEKAMFEGTPSFEGSIEYRRYGSREVMALGLLQRFVPNQGDAWQRALSSLDRFYERVLTSRGTLPQKAASLPPVLDMAGVEVPSEIEPLFGGPFFQMTELLGRRTAEMHLALAAEKEDPAFAPAEFSTLYQRSMYQTMQSQARRTLSLLGRGLTGFLPEVRPEAEQLLGMEKRILAVMRRVTRKRFSAVRTRIHGDYHLGQVLFTGKDFYIIDFEGEPARPIGERRLKRSPLRDVAGMVRSFFYAAHTSLYQYREGHIRREDVPELEPWADLWYRYASGAFMRAYMRTCGDAPFLPRDSEQLRIMLAAFLLDKAMYEVAYELNNRPQWLLIPLRGVRSLLEEEE